MIFAFGVALAGPDDAVWFGAGQQEWSLGAMTSWRTTPLRSYWAEEVQTARKRRLLGDQGVTRYSEPAIHLVASLRSLAVDVSAGSEFGWTIEPRAFEQYMGFRFGARLGVIVVSTRAPDDQVDPLNLWVGAGGITWISCCSASGSSFGAHPPGRDERGAFTVHVANRLWLWEPLGLDLRYEVPLAQRGFLPTVSAGIVFAARE